jgi:hypothetical protein
VSGLTRVLLAPPPVTPALEDTKIPQEGYTEIRIEQKDKEKDECEVKIGTAVFTKPK